MKRKIIQDWKSVSEEEMFLYELQNCLLHFYYVDQDEAVEFARFCLDHRLLSFSRQKEYAGTCAEFQVLKDFNIQWMPDATHGYHDHPVYTMQKDDALILTEFLNSQPKKRGLMNLYDEWRVEVNIPTELHERLNFYEQARQTLCE